MSLETDFTLKNSTNLQQRCAAALVIAAEAIRNESEGTSNHTNRLNWSKRMLNSDMGPELEAKKQLWLIIQNATIKSSGEASTDNDIQFVINGLIDYFSTPNI